MGERYSAKVCKNGHIITDYFDSPHSEKDISKFCERCGASVITECESCKAMIPGAHKGVAWLGPKSPPNFCNMCGKAYPWTDKKIERMSEFIKKSGIESDQLEDLESDLKKLKNSQLDEDEQKRLISKMKAAGRGIWDFVKPIISDLITETVKKHAGL